MHGKKEYRLIVVGRRATAKKRVSVNNSAKRRLKGDLIEPDCILQICAVVVRRYGRRELCTCSPPAGRPPSLPLPLLRVQRASVPFAKSAVRPSFPLRSPLTDFSHFVLKLVNLSAPIAPADANCDGGIE